MKFQALIESPFGSIFEAFKKSEYRFTIASRGGKFNLYRAEFVGMEASPLEFLGQFDSMRKAVEKAVEVNSK